MTSENVHYFEGIDPAPALGKRSDDGAIAILKAWPKPTVTAPTNNLSDWLCGYVWGYRLRGKSAREWSGLIHATHQRFKLSGICMDWNGGGTFIMQEMNKSRQLINGVEVEVVPITRPEDVSVVNAHFLLTMFKRGERGIDTLWPILKGDDNLVHSMHVSFQEAVLHGGVMFPAPFNERKVEPQITQRTVEPQITQMGADKEDPNYFPPHLRSSAPSAVQSWPIELQWALKVLDEGQRQLSTLAVAVQDDGTWLLTRNGAFQYSAPGKKDIAYAMIYAYVRFLIWLRGSEEEFLQKGEDASECSFM